MALSQQDLQFLERNFPGATRIQVDQVRELSSQLNVALSEELSDMLSASGPELDVAKLQTASPASVPDIDLSDIPLDLASAQPGMPDPDLSQYDDLMASGQLGMDADNAEAIAATAEGYVGAEADAQPSYGAPRPDEVAVNSTASADAFSQFSPTEDIAVLEGNEKFASPNDLAQFLRDYAASGKMTLQYAGKNKHRFLKPEEMRGRLADMEKGFEGPGQAGTLNQKDIGMLRYFGRGMANSAEVAREVDPTYYREYGLDKAETMFGNAQDGNQDQTKEAAMAEPNSEHNGANKPEGLNGQKDPAREIGEGIFSERQVTQALDALGEVASDGEVNFEVVDGFFRRFQVPQDEPVYQQLLKEHQENKQSFKVSDLRAFAEAHPQPTDPVSQPEEGVGAPQQERSPDGGTKAKGRGREGQNTADGHDPQQAPMQAGVVGAGFHAAGAAGMSLGKGLGAGLASGGKHVGAGLLGGAKHITGFIKQSQQARREFGQSIESGISTMSSKLDAIAQDRAEMKSAANLFERKQIADRMGSKLEELEAFATGFADKLSTRQGQKALKSGGLSNRLESLESKMERTFDGLEPGKGEKKAFESIKVSIETALEAVSKLFDAIRNAMSGPSRDAEPSLGHGPM